MRGVEEAGLFGSVREHDGEAVGLGGRAGDFVLFEVATGVLLKHPRGPKRRL